jgi:AcrR family transcriptional regulator
MLVGMTEQAQEQALRSESRTRSRAQSQPRSQPRPRQRRRGEELEAALLQAAWEELVEVGFARLTMESVAARAKTGVAVLYRRWPNKGDLTVAAIGHYGQMRPVEIPDTGSLREDLIALLGNASSMRVGYVATITAAFSGLSESSGLTPAVVREKLIADRPLWSDQIFARAQERGELDLDRIPPAVLTMPFDLMRHDMLMTYQLIEPERVREIVDDLFMPLVAMYQQK